MKLKSTSLFLGLFLIVMAVAAIPTYAEAVPGYESFHVERQSATQFPGAENCLWENYGAVINGCTYPVSLVFNLPTNAGGQTITVQGYWGQPYGYWPGDQDFRCDQYSYGGYYNTATNSPEYSYGGSIYFTAAGQSFNLYPDVPNNWSETLVCWNVLPGTGIANINW